MKLGKNIFFDLDKNKIKFSDNNVLYKKIKISKIVGYELNKTSIDIKIKLDKDKLKELKQLIIFKYRKDG